MQLSKFAKDKGMTLEEYLTLEGNIMSMATATIELIKATYITDNGVYHEITEVEMLYKDYELKPFVLQELKEQGLEFIENGTLWRL